MSNSTTTVERAFELARDGELASVDDIRKQLKAERYDNVDAHLGSPSLNRQLLDLIHTASTSGVS
jgi:hypothetical protein